MRNLVFLALLFVAVGCGDSKPVITSPADGATIFVGGFGQQGPILTVQLAEFDSNVQITFTPVQVPGVLCQAGNGVAQCFANSQNGSLTKPETLVIRARNGEEESFIVVTLTNQQPTP